MTLYYIVQADMAMDWFRLTQKDLPPPVKPETLSSHQLRIAAMVLFANVSLIHDSSCVCVLDRETIDCIVDLEPRLPDQEIQGFSYSKKLKDTFHTHTMHTGFSPDDKITIYHCAYK